MPGSAGLDDRYFFWFLHESYAQPEIAEQLAHSLGFCLAHGSHLADTEGIGSQIAVVHELSCDVNALVASSKGRRAWTSRLQPDTVPSRAAPLAAPSTERFAAPRIGKEAMIGQIATVVGGFAPAVGLRIVCGKVRLNGEFWSAEADRQQRDGLAVGRKVRIRSVEGLTLIVEPEQASRR